jgi:hypothetical protein
MATILQLLLGAFSCVALILGARRLGQKRELRIYAIGLVSAALIYVGFAVFGGASISWLVLELGGLALFSLVAIVGLRINVWALVLGWVAHVVWDVSLHKVSELEFVPKWYPIFCVGFDVLLAGYIAMRARKISAI